MNKLPYYLSVVIIAVAAIILLYVAYLALYPFKTVDLVQPIKVLNENREVAKGDDLRLEIDYVKHGSYPATSDKNILCADGNLVTLSSSETNLPAGKQKFMVMVTVPAKTSFGPCYLEYVNVYHINPLRDIAKTWRTEIFTVVEAQ